MPRERPLRGSSPATENDRRRRKHHTASSYENRTNDRDTKYRTTSPSREGRPRRRDTTLRDSSKIDNKLESSAEGGKLRRRDTQPADPKSERWDSAYESDAQSSESRIRRRHRAAKIEHDDYQLYKESARSDERRYGQGEQSSHEAQGEEREKTLIELRNTQDRLKKLECEREKELQEMQDINRSRAKELSARENAIQEREHAIQQQKTSIAEKENIIKARGAKLNDREAAITRDLERIKKDGKALAKEVDRLKAWTEELEKMEKKLDKEKEIFDDDFLRRKASVGPKRTATFPVMQNMASSRPTVIYVPQALGGQRQSGYERKDRPPPRAQHSSYATEPDSSPSLTGSFTDTEFYKYLEIEQTATTETIRKQYHKLALKKHPDKVQGDGARKEAAQAEFTKLQEAYEALIDEKRRKEYDMWLRGKQNKA